MSIVQEVFGVGGGVETVLGTFTINSNTEHEIEIGFRPQKLYVYKISGTNGSAVNAGSMVYLYDESVQDQTVFTLYQQSSGNLYAISASQTSNDSLNITDNGFKINRTSGSVWYGDYKYVAIRE